MFNNDQIQEQTRQKSSLENFEAAIGQNLEQPLNQVKGSIFSQAPNQFININHVNFIVKNQSSKKNERQSGYEGQEASGQDEESLRIFAPHNQQFEPQSSALGAPVDSRYSHTNSSILTNNDAAARASHLMSKTSHNQYLIGKKSQSFMSIKSKAGAHS